MTSKFTVAIAIAATLVVNGCGNKPEPAASPPPATTVSEAPPPQPTDDDGAAKREAEARRRAEAERIHAVVAQMIHFDFNNADLRSDARQVLDRKLAVLRENPGLHIRIEGHCDERGSDAYNLALGMRRAIATQQYLVNHGVDLARLQIKSWGEERPLDGGQNEAAWARNRRAEFHIAQGSLIAGR